jgi:hypothetical protein
VPPELTLTMVQVAAPAEANTCRTVPSSAKPADAGCSLNRSWSSVRSSP